MLFDITRRKQHAKLANFTAGGLDAIKVREFRFKKPNCGKTKELVVGTKTGAGVAEQRGGGGL